MRRPTLRPGRGALRAACAGAGLAAVAAAQAQTSASGVTLTPTFSVTETLTDNRDLSSTNRQADSITTVTPGVRISARTGQLQGGLNLAVNALHYARASDRNAVTLQTGLDSNVHYDALDNHVYVDATAVASQQPISAFGTQSAGTTLVDSNRSQVTTLTVAPGLRGRISDIATVDAQLNASKTDTGSTSLGDTTSYGARVGISGNAGRIGWGFDANEQVNDFKAGRRTTTDQYSASLSWAPSYDWRVSGRAGRARSDAQAVDPVWVDTTGWTVAWQPTDRTDLLLQGDRTYYGHSHVFTLRHRMERTVFSYTDSNGVAGDANALISVAPLTIYDLLLANCVRGGGTTASCDQAVRLVLAQQGVSPTLPVGGGFLYGGLTQQHYRNLSVSWSGQRQTATLSAFRTSSSALDRNNAQGDLALVGQVRQQGYAASVSHRLTEVSSLMLTLTRQRTLDADGQPGNQQKMVTLGWSGSLTDRLTGTLMLRHIDFASTTNPYQESALVGSLSVRF